jgi:hypothetical protein
LSKTLVVSTCSLRASSLSPRMPIGHSIPPYPYADFEIQDTSERPVGSQQIGERYDAHLVFWNIRSRSGEDFPIVFFPARSLSDSVPTKGCEIPTRFALAGPGRTTKASSSSGPSMRRPVSVKSGFVFPL